MENKNLDLIAAYIKNELTSEEARACKEKIAHDPEFKEAYEFQLNLDRVLKEKSDEKIKAQLASIESNIESINSNNENKVRRLFPRIASVAAIILLACGVFLFNSQNAEADLYASYFTPYPNEIVKIERGEGNPSTLQKAMIAYELGNYDEALQSFNQINEKGLDIYKAVALAALNKHEDSNKLLEQIPNGSQENLSNQIAWYKALNYIKMNDPNAAKIELNKLLKSNDNFRKKSATELLSKLK